MILFCEDCGQKNQVEQPAENHEPVRFTCTACGYRNTWRPKAGPSSRGQMPDRTDKTGSGSGKTS